MEKKSRCDLDLDRTISNVELELFSYTTICSNFKWIEQSFFSYCVHKLTHRQTPKQTHTHRDRHDYSIVAVDKPSGFSSSPKRGQDRYAGENNDKESSVFTALLQSGVAEDRG